MAFDLRNAFRKRVNPAGMFSAQNEGLARQNQFRSTAMDSAGSAQNTSAEPYEPAGVALTRTSRALNRASQMFKGDKEAELRLRTIEAGERQQADDNAFRAEDLNLRRETLDMNRDLKERGLDFKYDAEGNKVDQFGRKLAADENKFLTRQDLSERQFDYRQGNDEVQRLTRIELAQKQQQAALERQNNQINWDRDKNSILTRNRHDAETNKRIDRFMRDYNYNHPNATADEAYDAAKQSVDASGNKPPESFGPSTAPQAGAPNLTRPTAAQPAQEQGQAPAQPRGILGAMRDYLLPGLQNAQNSQSASNAAPSRPAPMLRRQVTPEEVANQDQVLERLAMEDARLQQDGRDAAAKLPRMDWPKQAYEKQDEPAWVGDKYPGLPSRDWRPKFNPDQTLQTTFPNTILPAPVAPPPVEPTPKQVADASMPEGLRGMSLPSLRPEVWQSMANQAIAPPAKPDVMAQPAPQPIPEPGQNWTRRTNGTGFDSPQAVNLQRQMGVPSVNPPNFPAPEPLKRMEPYQPTPSGVNMSIPGSPNPAPAPSEISQIAGSAWDAVKDDVAGLGRMLSRSAPVQPSVQLARPSAAPVAPPAQPPVAAQPAKPAQPAPAVDEQAIKDLMIARPGMTREKAIELITKHSS